MRILLTNDDGIHAAGIHALIKELHSLAEIYIAAPDRERSATGHSITVFDPIRAQKTEIPGVAAGWIIGGTPVDCVKLAICKLINEHVDLVISGINHGSNLGTDVLYSGTVSAAAEGVILGSPSLAVSLDSERVDADFNFCSRFIRRLITGIMKPDMDKTTLLNVNVPARPQQDIKGVRITRLGVRNYGNLFEERRDPRGNIYYWMGGGIIAEKQEPDSDVLAVEQGYVSVTPIHLDLTDYNLINKYRALPEKTLEFLVKGE